MTDEKKDLTGILQHSIDLQESGQEPAFPEGSVMEEQKIETIEEFETLEEFAITNPASEPSQEQVTSTPTPLPAPEMQPDISFNDPPHDFQVTPPLSESHTDLPAFDFNAAADDTQPLDTPPTEPLQKPNAPMEQLKAFSENISASKSTAPAAFPFSLLITGHLLPEEKEKLLEILSRENMGIREIDLEPQLAGGKILIPRISEYAGIVLVQALRGTRAEIKLGPSDKVFSTQNTREEAAEFSMHNLDEKLSTTSTDSSHPAENIPVTSEDKLPGDFQYTLIDTVTASAALKAKVVEAESSSEYQEIVEALQREIKYKAYRRGATAILHFKIQMSPLSSPTHYRILVTGAAVKLTPASASVSPSLSDEGDQKTDPDFTMTDLI